MSWSDASIIFIYVFVRLYRVRAPSSIIQRHTSVILALLECVAEKQPQFVIKVRQKLSADWLWVKVSRVHYYFKKEDEYIFFHLLFWANMQRRHDRNIFSMNNCGCDMYLGIWSDRSYFRWFGTNQIFSAIHDSYFLP